MEKKSFFYACHAAEAVDGSIYVADIIYVFSKSIRHFSVSDPENVDVFFESDSVLYKLNAASDGLSVITTDYCGFYHFCEDIADRTKYGGIAKDPKSG